MHWSVGKKRAQHGSAVDAARSTARSTRIAAAFGLIGALATIGMGIGAEIVDEETPDIEICTAVAIVNYNYLYELGEITHEEFEQLRADAIQDELDDTTTCERF